MVFLCPFCGHENVLAVPVALARCGSCGRLVILDYDEASVVPEAVMSGEAGE